MATTKADLILHPVRLRIVLETSADTLTTSELARRLPDVAQATLYRQIATLVDAGVLQVVDERRVRGGVERTLRLVPDAAGLGAADAASLTPDEHLTGFIAFVAGLVASFERYIRHPDAEPAVDPVGYRQVGLWLTDEETSRLLDDLRDVLAPYTEQEATPDRRRVRINVAVVPDVGPDGGAEPSG